MEFFSFLRRRRAARAGAKTAQVPESVTVAPEAPPRPPLQITLPLPPAEVRRLLFDAVVAGDEAKLDALCREHRAVIVENRERWQEVPAEFRSSAELSEWYAQGLAAIARYCAERALNKGTVEEAAAVRDLASGAVAESK